MAVSSFRELGRTIEGSIGEPTIARRRFVVILDDNAITTPTANLDVIAAVGGGLWGVAHPEFAFLKLRKTTMAENFENNPYHVEVTLEYAVLTSNQAKAPLERQPEWSYEQVSGEQIPALFYYTEGDELRPLTNSAYDFFEGLTVQEALTRITIKRNFAARPTGIIGSFGFINEGSFDGAAEFTCKHEGSVVTKNEELWGNVVVPYWRAESKILYRPSGWRLRLPDVGFNYLGTGGQKRRAMVFDFQNGEWIPSPNPVGLDSEGNQTSSFPAILTRRVDRKADFAALFGACPE